MFTKGRVEDNIERNMWLCGVGINRFMNTSDIIPQYACRQAKFFFYLNCVSENGIYISFTTFPSYKCKVQDAKFCIFKWIILLPCMFSLYAHKANVQSAAMFICSCDIYALKTFYMIPTKCANSKLESIFSQEINFGLYWLIITWTRRSSVCNPIGARDISLQWKFRTSYSMGTGLAHQG